jgi:hypothetical protein
LKFLGFSLINGLWQKRKIPLEPRENSKLDVHKFLQVRAILSLPNQGFGSARLHSSDAFTPSLNPKNDF